MKSVTHLSSAVQFRQSAPFIPKGRNETLTAMLRFFFVYNLSKYQLVYLKLALIEISNSFKFSSSIPAVGTIHSLMRRNQASTAMLRFFFVYNLSKYQLVYLKLALIEISNSFKFSSSIPAVGTIHSLMRRNQASTAMLRLFYLPVPPRPVNG